VDFVHERRNAYPNLHVYHYAAYEPSTLARLMGTYATREAEVDELLRGEVFVDLLQLVRQSLRAGVPRYSLKQIEQFFFERKASVRSCDAAVLAFERYLATGDESRALADGAAPRLPPPGGAPGVVGVLPPLRDGRRGAARGLGCDLRPRVRRRGAGTGRAVARVHIPLPAVAVSLDGTYLFVQGPPGSGKTYRGAQMIMALIAVGKKVGVTSQSHETIHNLLDEVERCARKEGVAFQGYKWGDAG
jgi:hypothetical protein